MRTFHIGGTASRVSEQSALDAKHKGTVRFDNLAVVERTKGDAADGDHDLIVMNRNGHIVVQDDKGRDRERYQVVYGAHLRVKDGQKVEPGQVLVEWDPYTFSILTEETGQVRFKDIIEGVTVHEDLDEITGLSRLIIVDSADEKRQPTVEIRGKDGKVSRKYIMPVHAHMMVQDGEELQAGDVLAKIPRETTKTKDITGGLPRVVELFEARKPRDPAVISEIDGTVKHGGVVKGQRKILIVPDEGGGEAREYSIPRGVHVNVQDGERVRAGDPLMDGPSNPHDILHVLGEKELQKYLVNEVQEVYRLQGVNINDKHIEVMVRQMLRWVRVEDVGDTEFLIDEQVDKFRFLSENERVLADGGRPGDGAAAAARHHQGVAVDRVVHLGGVVPGDHPRPHRGVHLRQGRSPARPEGERHDGPPHPGRHRLLVVPPPEHPGRRTAAAAGAAAAGRRRAGARPRARVPGRAGRAGDARGGE